MTDDIDRLLRDDATRGVADDGFSLRVLHALPRRRAGTVGWLKPALVFCSTALGCILAVVLSPAAGALVAGFQDLVQLQLGSPAAVSTLAICVVLLASAVVLAIDAE